MTDPSRRKVQFPRSWFCRWQRTQRYFLPLLQSGMNVFKSSNFTAQLGASCQSGWRQALRERGGLFKGGSYHWRVDLDLQVPSLSSGALRLKVSKSANLRRSAGKEFSTFAFFPSSEEVLAQRGFDCSASNLSFAASTVHGNVAFRLGFLL